LLKSVNASLTQVTAMNVGIFCFVRGSVVVGVCLWYDTDVEWNPGSKQPARSIAYTAKNLAEQWGPGMYVSLLAHEVGLTLHKM